MPCHITLPLLRQFHLSFTPLFNYHPWLLSYPLLTMRSRSILLITSKPSPFSPLMAMDRDLGFVTIQHTNTQKKEKVRWGHLLESPTTIFAYPGTLPLLRVASLPILLPLSFSSLGTPPHHEFPHPGYRLIIKCMQDRQSAADCHARHNWGLRGQKQKTKNN
jgi:hypothetical protein